MTHNELLDFINYGIAYTIPNGLSESELRLWQSAVMSAKQDIVHALQKQAN